MAKPALPKAQLSIASAKIANYLLDVTHPKGGPKARFFLACGFSVDDPEAFVACLFQHASREHLVRTEPSLWGIKYIFEGPIITPDRRSLAIRSVWQIKASNEGFLDLITAYPLD